MTDKWRIEATIPTVPYGNVHVGADTWSEMWEVLDDPDMDKVMDALRLAEATDTVRRAMPGTTSEPTERSESAPRSGGYGRRKDAAESRERGEGAGQQYCDHGQMRYYNGGQWQAYFCPLKKGDPNACQPRDAETGEEWKRNR